MSAKRLGAGKKRRVVVLQKNISQKRYTPPKLPNKPKVTVGPRSYGRTRKGNYIVVRFYVSRRKRSWKRRHFLNVWDVVDFLEGGIALSANPDGYESQDEAIQVARRLRDKYGAWAKSPF